MSVEQTREECKEALSTTVDNINLMKRHCMHYFLTLLQLTLRTLHKSCLQQR